MGDRDFGDIRSVDRHQYRKWREESRETGIGPGAQNSPGVHVMIVPINYPPTGSGGMGCGADCGCTQCSGMGDATTTPTTPTGIAPVDAIIGALTQTLQIGSTGIPVWVLAGAGIVAAAMLMPKPSRRYR
jgi:hypothetical protein